ncbi:probable cytochrome P450 6d5 [Anastrepha ludens]|uniref:probable cytochrome P450 6d5 n=1 Tax=Anastrepha ludens TaxID=28586 RepID=UPI0023B0DA64|nr:probable cytochrome P450 6d5 [Anastrepha ludens]XP_053969917.1 probable cytochrome P450 6d5 [Anastrepha ludens]
MFLLLLIAALTLIVFYIKWNYTYWQRKGFPYHEPKIPFGVLDGVRKREASLGTAIYDVYRTTKGKVVGIYLMTRPALLVRDAQLARDILAKDFESFHDRGIHVDDEKDPQSSGGLFFLKGQDWKNMRVKLAPSFTSGKLKAMFGTVEDISDRMVDYLNAQLPDEGAKELEIKEVMNTYAIDIIASAIFGLEVNSFVNPNNGILNVSRKINEPTFGSVVRATCQFLYPSLEKLFIRLGWREEAFKMMREIVKRTVQMREEQNITRKDLLQLLMQLRNKGQINTDDNDWSAIQADASKHMSIDTIATNLFLFYAAGYETTASSVSFTIFELAQHPEALEKAQRDVEEALQKHDNKFTYEAIQDMKYLDICVKETIRKYPGLPLLNRQCTHDYPLPDSNLVIKSGTPIIISLLGLHRDEKYFPDPMRWEPERFINKNYDPVAYMPFGEGPRHCIAQRMGQVNGKVALAKLLLNFNIELHPVRKEIEIANFGIPIMAKGGIHVRLSTKKSTQRA